MDEDFSGLDRMFMTSDELDRSTVTYSTVANVPESYERATWWRSAQYRQIWLAMISFVASFFSPRTGNSLRVEGQVQLPITVPSANMAILFESAKDAELIGTACEQIKKP